MKKNGYAAIAAGMVGLAMALTACSSSPSEPGSSGQPSGAGAGEITGEITFQTWNLKNDKYTPYFEGLIADFEAEHPGTTVTWVDQPAEGYQDKLSADAAAGTLPDVVDMGPEAAYTLGSADALLDVAKADPSAKDLYLPAAWDAMTFAGLGGGTYGFPWYLNTGPSFFNAALLDQCGLDADEPPTTYDEMFEQAKVLRASCPDKAMFARTPVIEDFGQYGVPLMNEDSTEFTFNDAKGVELLQKYVDLYQGQGLTEESLNALQTNEVDDFKAGRVAYLPGSSYTLNDLKESAPDVYDSLAITPRINNAAPNMYIESLVVNATTKNQATAIAFAKFVTNSENQMTFSKAANIFPSSAGTIDDPYFTTEDGTQETKVRVETAAQIGEAVIWWPPAFSGSSDAETLREQVAQAILGQQTAQQALDNAVDYANQHIAGN